MRLLKHTAISLENLTFEQQPNKNKQFEDYG